MWGDCHRKSRWQKDSKFSFLVPLSLLCSQMELEQEEKKKKNSKNIIPFKQMAN